MRVWLGIALLLGPALSAGTVEGRALTEAFPLPGSRRTPRMMAIWLGVFRSDAADQVAFKFMSDEIREGYLEARHQADCETMNLCHP